MDRATAEQLVARFSPGHALVDHHPLTGGVSAEVTHIRFDGGSFVVRRPYAADPGERAARVAALEHGLLAALNTAGIPVARPLGLDLSNAILPSAYLVVAFVPGTTEVPAERLDTALDAMAALLASLHALDPGAPGFAALPAREDPVAGALTYLPPGYDGLEAALRRRTYAGRNAPAVLHGDFWPGNLLWHDGRIAALLDWEDAAVGDPLCDLATSRVELASAYGFEAADRFTAAYLARHPLDVSDLPVWEAFVAGAALRFMGDWGLPAEVEARRRAATTAFVENAARALA
ncbi:MAG: phosphotransferase [Alphaproteobacteria bacterium]|nr:phosphotransferase [Alphaproteobacteria bacterium]